MSMGMSSSARPQHPWLHPLCLLCLPFVAQNNQYSAMIYSRNIQELYYALKGIEQMSSFNAASASSLAAPASPPLLAALAPFPPLPDSFAQKRTHPFSFACFKSRRRSCIPWTYQTPVAAI